MDGGDELQCERVESGDALVELERVNVLTKVVGQLTSKLVHLYVVHVQLTQLTLGRLPHAHRTVIDKLGQ